MKLIILIAIAIVLNVSLLNKQNFSLDPGLTTQQNIDSIHQFDKGNTKIKNNFTLPRIEMLKDKLLVIIKEHKKSILHWLTKTLIISINQSNAPQSITVQNIDPKDHGLPMKSNKKS